MGEVLASSLIVFIRKRWPSGETTYCWRLTVAAAPMCVANSATGLPAATT
jgi:hypothetical protein